MTYHGEGPISEEEAKAAVAEADAAQDDDVEPPAEPLEHELPVEAVEPDADDGTSTDNEEE